MKMKQCSKCGKRKSISEFYKNPTGIHDVRGDCKYCVWKYRQTRKTKKLKYNKRYYQINKVEVNKQHRQYRKTITGYLRSIFSAMKTRCTNPDCARYKDYGGRGIECRFENADDFICYVMGVLRFNTIEKLDGLGIDRINNDGHYEKGNIRFVTSKVNNNNKRKEG